MSEASERIWLTGFVKDEYGARLGRGIVSDLDHSPNPDYPEYIRADLVEAAVKRALEAAADRMRQAAATEDEMGHTINAALFDTAVSLIRALDPAQFIEGEK